MGQDGSQEGTSTQVNKGCVPTEHGSVSELKKRSEYGSNYRGVWVRNAEFIEMMHMGNAKIQGCNKDDMSRGDPG